MVPIIDEVGGRQGGTLELGVAKGACEAIENLLIQSLIKYADIYIYMHYSTIQENTCIHLYIASTISATL